MTHLLIILASVVLSAFFSGMEIAFVSSNKLRFELDKKHGFPGAGILNFFMNKPGEYIATMLVGNNIALVVFGIFMAIILEPLIILVTTSEILIIAIQTTISTLIILFTAEFLPKALFRIYPNSLLKFFSIPVFLVYIMLFPVIKFIMALSNLLLRIFFGIPADRQKRENALGRIDLGYLIAHGTLGEGSGEEAEHEIKIFQNALDFSKVKLRDCMVPRTEIVAFEEKSHIEELKQKFIETGLSKILVYRDNIDNIIGYISSKELFRDPDDIRSILVTMPIVPETMPANKLLQSFISSHKSLAVVVDEFGGTSGMVTMEDIIEEIFGEIEDEHDTSELIERQLKDNEFIFSGRLEIDYLNEKYKIGLPKTEDYETVAGLILFHYESIPKINERIVIEPFVFKILDVSETRIELVHITKYSQNVQSQED